MAAYKNYTSTFYSNRNNRYDLEIWSKSETSTGNTFNVSKGGFKLSYKGSDDRNNITKPSELTFNFMVENADQETYLTTLLSSDDTEYFVIVRRNFVIFWWGGLKAGFDSFDNDYYPFVVTLKATDYIGDFINKKEDTALPDDVLAYAGEVIGTNLHNNSKINSGGSNSFLVSCFPLGADQLLNRFNNRWVGEDQTFGDAVNPFSKQKINYNNFLGANPSEYSQSDAYQGYLKSFSMCAFQADGFYNVIQPFSYTSNTFRVNKKKIGQESYALNIPPEGQDIDNRQNAENDSSVAADVDSGFHGTEWVLEPADFTDSGWSITGSVTSITAKAFTVASTFDYLNYLMLEAGDFCVSYSQNDTTVYLTYQESGGSEVDLLTESGQVNFSVAAIGILRVKATSSGSKSVEYIGLQKGRFENRRFVEGQSWRYQRPYGRVSASYNFGNSFAQLVSNSTSTTSSIYTTLTNIGSVSSAALSGAILNTGFSYLERFDTLSQGIESINGYVECKLKIGTQYLTGTVGALSWTLVDSTFTLTVPTWASFSNSDNEYNWYFNNGPTLDGPQWYEDTGSLAKIQFGLGVALPDIPASGAISFQFVSATINYYTFDFDLFSGTAPTPSTITKNNLETRWSVSSFFNTGLSFIDIGEQSVGVDYTATTPNLDNFDSFDMGDMPIGNTSNEDGFESALTVVDSLGADVISTYVKVNNTGTEYQITSLASQEYISLQASPLKMIEGNYYVNDFSAFMCIVLDGEKYVFSEGTLTADTDTVSGTWYKISETTETITVIDDTIFDDEEPPPPNPHDDGHFGGKLSGEIDKYNSIGLTSSEYSEGVSYTKIDIINTARGLLYNDQKLLLTDPEGAYPMILIKDGDSTTATDELELDSFTPIINYPVGSILSMLVYDLTNVINTSNIVHPAGITREIQFNDAGEFKGDASFEYDKLGKILSADNIDGKHFGTNIGVIYNLEMYLTPLDFKISSGYRNPPYTDDDGATIRPSSASVNYYASFQVPIGYEATRVDLKSSSDDAFEVLRCSYSTSGTTSIGLGTTNTELTLSSVLLGAAGTYGVILWNPSSTTDELYGCKITLART